jgi:hypothetical protein
MPLERSWNGGGRDGSIPRNTTSEGEQMIKRTLPYLIVAVTGLLPRRAFAQLPPTPKPEISLGFIVPIDINTQSYSADAGEGTTGGKPGIVPGLWGETAFYASPRISFHSVLDVPSSYQQLFKHDGSAAFDAAIQRRDILLYELLGIRSTAGKSRPTWLVGGGLAWARSDVDVTHINTVTGSVTQRESIQNTQTDFVIVGGFDAPVQTTKRSALVVRLRGKVVFRRGTLFETGDAPGRFGISPGIGYQIRF